MKQLSGQYRAVGSNTKTDREFYGELHLVQKGSALTGSYRFSTSWDDPSPVAFGLPEYDCAVEGEVLADGCNLEIADEEALLWLSPEERRTVRPDAVLRFGGEQVFVLQLGDGTLVSASDATLTLTHVPLRRVSAKETAP